MDEIEARLVARAGNPPVENPTAPRPAGDAVRQSRADAQPTAAKPKASALPLPDAQIESLVRQFKK